MSSSVSCVGKHHSSCDVCISRYVEFCAIQLESSSSTSTSLNRGQFPCLSLSCKSCLPVCDVKRLCAPNVWKRYRQRKAGAPFSRILKPSQKDTPKASRAHRDGTSSVDPTEATDESTSIDEETDVLSEILGEVGIPVSGTVVDNHPTLVSRRQWPPELNAYANDEVIDSMLKEYKLVDQEGHTWCMTIPDGGHVIDESSMALQIQQCMI